MSSIENLYERGYKPTDPWDPNDPPKFGQITETAKDAFKKELYEYMSYKTSDAEYKLDEIPNIQKFALGDSTGENSLETVVNLILSYGDDRNRFPMVAITTTSVREKKLNIGSNFGSHVQYPPSGEDEDVNEVVQRASNDLQQVEELLNQLLGYLDFLESGGDISEYELW